MAQWSPHKAVRKKLHHKLSSDCFAPKNTMTKSTQKESLIGLWFKRARVYDGSREPQRALKTLFFYTLIWKNTFFSHMLIMASPSLTPFSSSLPPLPSRSTPSLSLIRKKNRLLRDNQMWQKYKISFKNHIEVGQHKQKSPREESTTYENTKLEAIIYIQRTCACLCLLS